MDDGTMHELYMWPFADIVHAGAASVMCSYQRLNNSYLCHNSKALNGLLKTELSFQGFVVSDWCAGGVPSTPVLQVPWLAWTWSCLMQTNTGVPKLPKQFAMDLCQSHILPKWLLELWLPGTSLAKLTQISRLSLLGFQVLEAHVRRDRTQLFWDFDGTARMNSKADACLIFINAAASEGVDRPALRDDYSDGLVLGIASRCNNTMVIIHNAGVRMIDQWIEHPNITAVIFAHLPGQDSGEAITKILYGDVGPIGKLPYSLPRNDSDYGSLLSPVTSTGWDHYFPQDNFTEGVFIDYRAFDMNGITPRLELGYGMTYTTFRYSNLTVHKSGNLFDLSEYPIGPVIPGGSADLWETKVAVTADITNTGQMVAAEAAQLYIQIPAEDQLILQLRGFEKVNVPPGETRTISFNIRRRDLSIWDVAAQKWKLILGAQYPVFVGTSSRKLMLNGTLEL